MRDETYTPGGRAVVNGGPAATAQELQERVGLLVADGWMPVEALHAVGPWGNVEFSTLLAPPAELGRFYAFVLF